MTFLSRLADVFLAGILAGITYYEVKSVAVTCIIFFVMVVVFNLDRYITEQRIKEKS